MDAVIYLRVSTKEQAAKDESAEGYSIPAQREACLRHIAERGWNLEGDQPLRTRRRSGAPVSVSKLAEVLATPFGVGVVQWGDVRSPGQHKALVSQPLFDLVLQTLKSTTSPACVNDDTSTT